MKWWFTFWDRVLEFFTGESHNAGDIGFRTSAMVVWFLLLGLAVLVAGVCFKLTFVAAVLYAVTVVSGLMFASPWKK